MARKDAIEVKGTVVEVLPNHLFRVLLPKGQEIIAHNSGAVRLHFVRIGVGDQVRVEVSPYDLSKGRIVIRRP